MSMGLVAMALVVTLDASAPGFDHEYAGYAEVLQAYVRGARVDYAALKGGRQRLDAVVAQLGRPTPDDERGWSRAQRMAFWINAYNVLTLQAMINHYPIQSRLLTIGPRNSIRQIDGVWTSLAWQVAGRRVTLDDIEHKILRPEFGDARIHFAVNCASVSCPPLAAEPYRAAILDAQLDAAARRYLASPHGLRATGNTVSVSSIFKWYGGDFIASYAARIPGPRPEGERAILGAIAAFGPAASSAAALTGSPTIRYISYDWSLNDAGGAADKN
ncbi:MAG: DUF547 domain-containing protein [Vicinamibacterales bacterium]